MTTKILAVAMSHGDGGVWTLPQPPRHHDLVHWLIAHGGKSPTYVVECAQGFITTDGQFLKRPEAVAVAVAAGQVINVAYDPKKLFSEDLW